MWAGNCLVIFLSQQGEHSTGSHGGVGPGVPGTWPAARTPAAPAGWALCSQEAWSICAQDPDSEEARAAQVK